MMSFVGDIAAPPTIGFSAKATVAKRPRLPAARIVTRRFFMMFPHLPLSILELAVEQKLRPTEGQSFNLSERGEPVDASGTQMVALPVWALTHKWRVPVSKYVGVAKRRRDLGKRAGIRQGALSERKLTAGCAIQCSKNGPNPFFAGGLQAPTSGARRPKSLRAWKKAFEVKFS